MRLGLLTGGGDCPGLNAVIRAVVVAGHQLYGDTALGILDGWAGAVEGRTMELDPERARTILDRGGTILGSSRTNPYALADGETRILKMLAEHNVDALIAIGGDDTLGVASRLSKAGFAVVGVPKTIDNDLPGTEMTFGFDTAVQIATEAIDRLQTTAESHHRVMVCEVMGRNVGHIATYAGIAGGAADILIPEIPFDIDAVCGRLRRRHEHGRFFSVVVVAEGAMPADEHDAKAALEARQSGRGPDAFGHARLGGIGNFLAYEIERRTGIETRATVLGHIQRGGTPTAFDRVLATRFGAEALMAVHDGETGVMVAARCGQIARIPFEELGTGPKQVDRYLYDRVATAYIG